MTEDRLKLGGFTVTRDGIMSDITALLSDSAVQDEARYRSEIGEFYGDPDETACAMLHLVAADWEGVTQPESILPFLGIEDIEPDDEFVWEEIDKVASETSDKLNHWLNLPDELTVNGITYCDPYLTFGTMEHSADYGILVCWYGIK